MKKLISFSYIMILCILWVAMLSCTSNSGLPRLETEVVTSITQTSAISGGKIISRGDSEIKAKGVCWSTNVRPSISESHSSDGSDNNDFISEIIGLIPRTEYHVRAYATNDEGTTYGNEKVFMTLSATSLNPIIADHNVVDKYNDIPQYYINEVKKMLLVIAGQSHSYGYMNGLTALESLYPIYGVNFTGTPESYTTSHLRISRTTWGDLTNGTGWINDYGEEDWYTSDAAISRTKAGISYYNSLGIPMTAFGFGHCWGDGGGDYIKATQSYIDYCTANNLKTKVFFTTGPVDQYYGYNDYLVHESIRDYVAVDSTRILFDYADILCYDDGSTEPYTIMLGGYVIPVITPTNDLPETISHISKVGELRIAKAVWWMLARIAGWDGK